MMTIPELEARHMRETELLLRDVLELCGWRLRTAARLLDVTAPRLQRLLARLPDLDAERRARGPRWGRPAEDGRPGCGGRPAAPTPAQEPAANLATVADP